MEQTKKMYGTSVEALKIDLIYEVYRKTWYGEKLFYLCEEVVDAEDCIICKTDGLVVAILPKRYLSCVKSSHLEI